MKSFAPIYRFGKGLQTRTAEDFGKPDEFRVFQNARCGKGLLERRPGQARVGYATTAAGALSFTALQSHVVTVPLDVRPWTLGVRWSLRFTFQLRTVGVTQYLLGYAGAGVGSIVLRVTSGNKLVAAFSDSTPTTTTLTGATTLAVDTTYSGLVTRDKSTLKLWLDNAVDASSTSVSATLGGRVPTAALTLGAHQGADFLDGFIDNVVLYSTVFADNSEGLLRCVDPMAEDVLACYTGELDANYLVNDWSRFGNTGEASGTMTSVASLCVLDTMVTGCAPFIDRNGKKRAVLVAGGKVYGLEVV